MIESVLDLDGLAGILRDIEEDEIIFLEIVPEEEERVERLGEDVERLEVEEVSIDGIDGVDGALMQIDDVEPEKDLSGFSDDMLLLFAIDMDAIDIRHDPFPVHIMVLLSRLGFLFHDLLEVVDGEFLLERLEDIEPEKREPALIEHEIMLVFGILP